MTILYKIVTIENFADDAATEAALDAEGADDWNTDIKNSKPNPQTGKSIATIIFKKTLSSSSSSSSTSSSSLSSSLSSSSNSDAPWMGSGWPYGNDQIEITIGNKWIGNIPFSEDDIIRLKRAPDTTDSINYTENGTLLPDNVINRLQLSFKDTSPTTVVINAKVVETLTDDFSGVIYAYYTNNLPYNFKSAFTNSFTMTKYVYTSFMDVTANTGFSPALQYNGGVFKTFTFIEYSSSSSSTSSSSTSKSSSSTSQIVGGFILIDENDQSGNYNNVWTDGTFVYAGCGEGGIKTHSVDVNGKITFIDEDYQGEYENGNEYRGMWSDGTFLYVACTEDGLRSYSVDGSGNLTYIDTDRQGSGSYYDVRGNGSYIIVAGGDQGVRSYSVDGSGILTHVDSDYFGGNARSIWIQGSYIIVGNGGSTAGLSTYTIDGSGILTHVDSDWQATSFYYSAWSDGTFVYAATSAGLMTYSMDGSGILTHIDTDDQGDNYLRVWGDGTYIYTACNAGGIRSHTVDGGGNITYIDVDYQYGQYNGVHADGNFIYVACGTRGLRTYVVRES